ncbi:MAG: type II toxin-antitoxin system PemK/MazF family toxin [Monoglobales bacterium]
MEEENNLKDNAIVHKDNSLNRLDISFLKHIDLEEYKTSHLLAYWINDFANYHDEERTFDTTKLITFKRGRIIKANLGFNIGHELGGLHYCIVLDKYDNPKNGTLNVIPLTSKKDKKYPKSSIDLGNEIYNSLNKIYSLKIEELSTKYNDIWSLPSEQVKQFTYDFNYVKKMKDEIAKMKKGSIALINQITTISKQRIFDDDILRQVRLTKDSLDLLDKNIIKFLTK